MAPILKQFYSPFHKYLILTYKTQRYIFTSSWKLQKNVAETLPQERKEFDTSTPREKVIRKKFIEIMDTYEELTGLKEVRMYQDRVIDAQEKLLLIQDQRRILNEELNKITTKRNELQSRFHTLSRDDPEWYSTIGEENRLLLDERRIRGELHNVERDERDYFTYMSNAVRDSHEKQRWQGDRTKYWSLLLTVISSFVTYLISDWRHKRLVRQLVENHNEVHPENFELKKIIPMLNEATTKLKSVSVTNTVTYETIHNLQNIIKATLDTEIEIKNNLQKFNKSLTANQQEILNMIAKNNQQQINFLGENANANLDNINAVHGASFGLGILCTCGVIFLLSVVFSQR
ncbi:uncharacterized protein LOC123297534 [Chrysoperla carnea]|uniref:uncharacterized protein LOC123297534 n=1 Tax=Chrysoperla carnea TaxID=189513 RepID=UPI001D0754A0|nr:uncharacterized protein LOC123297534 [Chrysoperla carnea]